MIKREKMLGYDDCVVSRMTEIINMIYFYRPSESEER